MNYENYILNYLLNKYEGSKAFVTGIFTQRISLVVAKNEELNASLQDVEEKNAFIEALANLRHLGLIDYTWVKYEKGNLVERLWLVAENIPAAYAYLGRKPKAAVSEAVYKLVEAAWQECQLVNPGGEIAFFLQQEMAKILDSKGSTVYFPNNGTEVKALLRALVWLNNKPQKTTERLLSVELYNDSKYFERYIKGKVLAIIRQIRRKQELEIGSDEDLLSDYGLSRWPEVYEFLGNVMLTISKADRPYTTDFATCCYGAYIDSMMVANIEEISVMGIDRVIFIENKANYEWYKTNKLPNELVIYHGGHYGLTKGKWFQLLYEAAKKQNIETEFYHWSDIDLGGFYIFVNLRKIIPCLQPYKMDSVTYKTYVNSSSKEITQEYCNKLQKLLLKEEFAVFHDVIKLILKNGKTLEQEQIII